MIHPTVFNILNSTAATLDEMLADYPAAVIGEPHDEGWSVHHVVAHIVDVDAVIFDDRIHRILDEDRPFIRSIDPLARMQERGLLDRDVCEMLEALETRRPEECAALMVLTEEQLARTGEHDEAGPITVSDLIHQWAYHDLMHLKQAASILQAPLVAGMGNTRKFYDL